MYILTTTRQVKTGKTTYATESTCTEVINQEQFDNIIDSAPSFRRLGGSETITKAYTCNGYQPVKLVSTNPDKQQRTIREFTHLEYSRKGNYTIYSHRCKPIARVNNNTGKVFEYK